MKRLIALSLALGLNLGLTNPPQIPVVNAAGIKPLDTLAYIFYECELGICASPLDLHGLESRLTQGQYWFYPEYELYNPNGSSANVRLTSAGYSRLQGVRGIHHQPIGPRYGMMIGPDFFGLDVMWSADDR